MPAGAQGQEPDAHLALFDALYSQHHRAVHAYLLGAVGDGEVAVDLLQDVFLRVWQHRETLAGVSEERRRYWLFHVARNICLDYYRRQGTRRAHEVPLPDGESSAAPSAPGLTSTVAVDAAIARLPDNLRVVLVMSALGGMNSSEIGEALDRPAGTVRYQLLRARRLLVEDLYPSPVPSPRRAAAAAPAPPPCTEEGGLAAGHSNPASGPPHPAPCSPPGEQQETHA